MSPSEAADRALLETSRTFYLPIVRLPLSLRQAVTSAYLCLRAIDEIEDHVGLTSETKSSLLRDISTACAAQDLVALHLVSNSRDDLAEVSKCIGDWMRLAPSGVTPAIWKITGRMAGRMAHWAQVRWRICTLDDLDNYTFDVAGSVGVLLSDLWYWHDGTKANRSHAIGFGRGLQAVNILRNRTDDLARGVDFFPVGWDQDRIRVYAEYNLSWASAYVDALPLGHARDFCQLPLDLAHATLQALQRGEQKLTRSDVMRLTSKRTNHRLTQQSTLTEMLILVNESDEIIGIEEKIRTHQLGALHRAFSIFVFNNDGDLLLQKRANTKYHSRGLWSNTCCGHPRFEESIKEACHRRLQEEMGFDCELNEILSFRYRAVLENDLIEHEYDHVFVGCFDGIPHPDSNEVEDWKWEPLSKARSEALLKPAAYTRWFGTAIGLLAERLSDSNYESSYGNARKIIDTPLPPSVAGSQAHSTFPDRSLVDQIPYDK